MKLFKKIQLAALALVVGLASCEKTDNLPYNAKGTATVLSASATTIAPTAADSNKTAVTFSWTSPLYSTDSSSYKYVLQIDSAGRNFSKANSIEINAVRSYSLIAKDLNTMMLNYGFEFNKQYSVDVRVISSYRNNNEQYNSNVVTLKVTPYKIPPKVVLPASGKLFIIGDATQGGWSNPVPVPSQELSRIDETTFGGVFNLFGGASYLILPENGQWGKYSVAKGDLAGLWEGGDFGSELRDNFPAPPVDGWYKLVFDFQKGKFKVSSSVALPDSIYTIGDATAGGWDNVNSNTTLKAQYLTRVSPWVFEGTQTLTGGANVKFISQVSQWQPQFGKGSKDGELGYNYGGGNDPGTISVPSSGTYKIQVNFYTMTYTLTKQ